jgi:hypothetical protein
MKKLLLSLCFLALPTLALAGETWIETFNGVGGGADRDTACNGARTTAQTAAMAACLMKGGSRGDQKFGDCSSNCQTVGPAQVCSSTVALTVVCATAGGSPPAPAPQPAPSPK